MTIQKNRLYPVSSFYEITYIDCKKQRIFDMKNTLHKVIYEKYNSLFSFQVVQGVHEVLMLCVPFTINCVSSIQPTFLVIFHQLFNFFLVHSLGTLDM